MSLSRSPQNTQDEEEEESVASYGPARTTSPSPSSHRESVSGCVTHSVLNSLIANEGAESTSDRAENGREEEKLYFLLSPLSLRYLLTHHQSLIRSHLSTRMAEAGDNGE